MEQPVWLTVAQVLSGLSAPLMVIFSYKLVQAQRTSNGVLNQQTQLQAAQQRLQEQLVVSEVRPLVSVYLSLAAPPHLILFNLGKYGAEIEGVWIHRHLPTGPSGGEAVRFEPRVQGLGVPSEGAPIFPLGLAPGASVALSLPTSLPISHETEALEVRYRHGANPGALLSDLWRIERSQEGRLVRLARVWQARPVGGKG